MKIRYAIEKEIEVPDDYTDEMIDDVIKAKCDEEKGFDYLWQDADESNDLFFKLMESEEGIMDNIDKETNSTFIIGEKN